MFLVIRFKKAWIFLLLPAIMGMSLLRLAYGQEAADWQTPITEIVAGAPAQEEWVTLPAVFLRYNALQRR